MRKMIIKAIVMSFFTSVTMHLFINTYFLIVQGSCQSSYVYFDGCPVVLADDDTACIHPMNTPGTVSLHYS